MNPIIIPFPKKAEFSKENFYNITGSSFYLTPRGLPEGEFLRRETLPHPPGLSAEVAKQYYEIEISEKEIVVRSFSDAGARHAAQTLRQIMIQADGNSNKIQCAKISDWPDLPVRGFMLDISRCKVPQMQSLVRLIDVLALFKFNRLELYTEHTYAFKNHEIVWGASSPMTSSEYAKLNAICTAAGIELVPNINGLGHFERWLRYPRYAHLAESKAPFTDPMGNIRPYPTTLYPSKESVDFMEGLYSDFLPNFTSDKVNIGGDEPWELGMGRSAERCASEGKYKVYLSHMAALNSLCEERGKKVFFWSDVMMKSPELIPEFPENMTPVVWGYEPDHPFDEQCSLLQKAGRKFLLAPGTSTWNSFGSRIDQSFENISNVARCARQYGASGAILTNWGDGGNHQPWCGMYPSLVFFAAAMWGDKASEEMVCQVLNRVIFFDSKNKFASALCAMGRFEPPRPQRSLHHEIFFADAKGLEKILAENQGFNYDAMFAAAENALSLIFESKIASADGNTTISECVLACEMVKFAASRGKCADCDVSQIYHQNALKTLVGDFESIWVMRARSGGLHEASSKIRAVCPEIFI